MAPVTIAAISTADISTMNILSICIGVAPFAYLREISRILMPIRVTSIVK